jgi:uncharacterized membrane protein
MTTNPSASVPSGPATHTDDKTVAILSYLTLIGFIVALILHSSKKTELGAYHLRQTFGLMLTSIAVLFVGMVLVFVPYVGALVSTALWIALLVLWVVGLINAAKGEMKPMPILGEQFQRWFAGTFN